MSKVDGMIIQEDVTFNINAPLAVMALVVVGAAYVGFDASPLVPAIFR